MRMSDSGGVTKGRDVRYRNLMCQLELGWFVVHRGWMVLENPYIVVRILNSLDKL